MKKSFGEHEKQKCPENGAHLYRAIDYIDEKWIMLANDPSVTLARTVPDRKRRSANPPSPVAVVCAILLLLLVTAELFSAVVVYSAPLTISEIFAREHSERYSDATDDRTYTELLAYCEETTFFLRQYDEVTKAARTGKIALSEYRAYMERYHYLEPRALSLERFARYAEYLRGVETEHGVEVQILYRSAWERFFERDRFPILIASLSVSACLIAILAWRYTFSKRKRVASAFTIGASVSLVLCLIELMIFFILCRPEGLAASMVSLERFSTFPPALTIGGYLTLRILLTALLSSAVAALLTSLLVRLPKPQPTPKEIQRSKLERRLI